MARQVGTAPGTSTVEYYPYANTPAEMKGKGGLGIATETDWWRTGRAATIHHRGVPLSTIASGYPGLQGLGIASPTQWWRTGSPTTIVHDNMPLPAGVPTGENLHFVPNRAKPLGLVSDEITRTLSGSGLGDVPNDFELAKMWGYLPVMHGWVNSDKGTYETGSLGEAEQISEEEKRAREAHKLQKFFLWSGGVAALGGLVLGIATFLKK